ncbi:MAG: tetratricopeptide repeat protein [Myxococcota bacterium]
MMTETKARCRWGAAMAVLLLLGLFARPRGAEAADDDKKRPPPSAIETSQEATETAVEIAKEGKLDEALPYFERAFEIADQSYDAAGNLGIAMLRLERYPEAAQYLQLALVRLPSTERERRPGLEEQLEQAKAKVVTVRVQANARFGVILVDGKEALTLPSREPIFVTPGKHTLQFEDAQLKRGEPIEFEGQAGEQLKVLAPSPRAPATVTPTTAPSTPDAGKDSSEGLSTAAIVAIVAGAATVVSGAALLGVGLTREGRRSEAEDQLAQANALDPNGGSGDGACASPSDPAVSAACGNAADELDGADDLNTPTNALIGTTIAFGAVSLAALTYALVFEDGDDGADTGLTVAPILGPHVQGLTVGGAF